MVSVRPCPVATLYCYCGRGGEQLGSLLTHTPHHAKHSCTYCNLVVGRPPRCESDARERFFVWQSWHYPRPNVIRAIRAPRCSRKATAVGWILYRTVQCRATVAEPTKNKILSVCDRRDGGRDVGTNTVVQYDERHGDRPTGAPARAAGISQDVPATTRGFVPSVCGFRLVATVMPYDALLDNGQKDESSASR